MTKADIVNEIAKSTGAEKVQVQAIVEAFMESIKGSGEEEQRISPRLRQLHRQEARHEGSPQYFEEYHDYDSGTRHPRVQARQELRREGEIGPNRIQT